MAGKRGAGEGKFAEFFLVIVIVLAARLGMLEMGTPLGEIPWLDAALRDFAQTFKSWLQ